MALIDKDGDENKNLMETMNLLGNGRCILQFFEGVKGSDIIKHHTHSSKAGLFAEHCSSFAFRSRKRSQRPLR
jgi:hypothetical protein